MKLANFNSIPFKDTYGNNKGIIDGQFSKEELAAYLIDFWVSYVECHHCPRGDYCRYSIPHPKWDWKKQEIKCGVKSDFIKNFIELTFDQYLTEDPELKERLLSATFHLSEYVMLSENQIGWAISKEWLENLGKYSHTFIGNLIHLRELLNQAAQDLSFFPDLYWKKPILLVEGQSEKAFIDKLRETNNLWFSNLRIEVYGGNGNAHPRRIQMRLEKYLEDGYTCYMQGDKDGKQKGSFDKIIRSGVVKEENTFLFKYDFESSIPKKLLYKVLSNLELLHGITLEEFCEKTDRKESICIQLQNKLNTDITPYKMQIADELGWVFINSRFLWYQDKSNFMEKAELGRFLDFIIKMK